jgi:integrase
VPRPVPGSTPAEQVPDPRDHLAEYGTTADGLLFRGHGGGLISDTTYTRTWHKARQAALSHAEAASPLAARPYDLRHACLSTWLNAGAAPAQVAEWAGNSVPVLLRVYTKCLTSSEQTALHQISQAHTELH